MNQHVAEIRDAVEADDKEARAGFTEAVNASMKEVLLKVRAESELRRRRDTKEVAIVAKD